MCSLTKTKKRRKFEALIKEKSMKLVASGYSTCGAFHTSLRMPNEDAILVDEACGLFAAVDGVSTEPRGDIAARCVVEALTAIAATDPDKRRFAQAFVDAENAITEFRDTEGLPAFPKACVTAVWLREGTGGNHIGLIGHAGDTSAFLVHHTAETITRLTTSHTVQVGQRNLVTRYVGGKKAPPDLSSVLIPPNCTLLLVTDGVTKKLNPAEIKTKTLHTPSPQELVLALVRLAITAGEADDISVVAVRTLRF